MPISHSTMQYHPACALCMQNRYSASAQQISSKCGPKFRNQATSGVVEGYFCCIRGLRILTGHWSPESSKNHELCTSSQAIKLGRQICATQVGSPRPVSTTTGSYGQTSPSSDAIEIDQQPRVESLRDCAYYSSIAKVDGIEDTATRLQDCICASSFDGTPAASNFSIFCQPLYSTVPHRCLSDRLLSTSSQSMAKIYCVAELSPLSSPHGLLHQAEWRRSWS